MPASLDLPRYFIVGDRPVKAVANRRGGLDVLAFDWTSGDFVVDGSYLERLFVPNHAARRVSAAEFTQQVRALQRRISGDVQPKRTRTQAPKGVRPR